MKEAVKASMKKYKMVAVIAAVITIPLVYSYLYLYAFWDPYSKLNELPVAVVTEDVGGMINGTQKNIGEEIINNLKTNDKVKWVFTDSADAKAGVEGEKYYAEIIIPENFTKEIATADSAERVQGLVIYNLNEKRNFLAGQIMGRVAAELEASISESISEEIVKAMTDEVAKLPGDLTELKDGLGEMKDGTGTLFEKTGDLVNGQSKFNNGLVTLDKGLISAKNGSTALKDGTTKLADGASQFSEALKTGAEKTVALKAGSETFNTGLLSLNDSLKKYTAGVGQYVDGINQGAAAQAAIGTSLKAYLGSHPEAMKDPNMQAVLKTMEASKAGQAKLAEASASLKGSGPALSEGSEKLAGAYTQINQGVVLVAGSMDTAAVKATELSKGASAVAVGMNQIQAGLGKATEGSKLLVTNSAKILEGENKLKDGINTLDTGVLEAKDKVAESVTKANEKVVNMNGLDTYTADPVTFEEQKINAIPDYGTAFTPYFVSLSLWVGALMMFFAIYLDTNVRFRRSNSKSKGYVRFFAYTAIGLSQSLVLAFVLRTALDLQVKNVTLFYLTCMAISLAFVSIMRFLLVHVGEVGKFFAVLILILQLTACGGTFPMELVPRFFQVINPYMPMTYSVNVLKEVISGIDYSLYNYNIAVLLGLAVGFFILNIGIAKIKTDRNPTGDPIF